MNAEAFITAVLCWVPAGVGITVGWAIVTLPARYARAVVKHLAKWRARRRLRKLLIRVPTVDRTLWQGGVVPSCSSALGVHASKVGRML